MFGEQVTGSWMCVIAHGASAAGSSASVYNGYEGELFAPTAYYQQSFPPEYASGELLPDATEGCYAQKGV